MPNFISDVSPIGGTIYVKDVAENAGFATPESIQMAGAVSEHDRIWKSRIPLADSRIVNVFCIGDSFTYGIGSTLSPKKGYPDYVEDYLSALSMSGDGFYPMLHSPYSKWSVTGGWWNGSQGFPCTCGISNWTGSDATASVTVSGTTAKLIYRGYTTSGNITYSVNGGATSNIAVTPATNWSETDIALGSAGSHTILLTFSGANKVIIAGVLVTSGTTGILINNFGIPDAAVVTMSATLDAAALALYPPDLSIVFIGMNDWNVQTALSTFTTRLTSLTTMLEVKGAVALVTLPYLFGDDDKTIPVSAYSNIIRNHASQNGFMTIDLERYWGNKATNTTLGYLGANGHPTNSGHKNISFAVIDRCFPRNILFLS